MVAARVAGKFMKPNCFSFLSQCCPGGLGAVNTGAISIGLLSINEKEAGAALTDEETATGEGTTGEVVAGVDNTIIAVETGGLVTLEDSATGTVAAVTSPA